MTAAAKHYYLAIDAGTQSIRAAIVIALANWRTWRRLSSSYFSAARAGAASRVLLGDVVSLDAIVIGEAAFAVRSIVGRLGDFATSNHGQCGP